MRVKSLSLQRILAGVALVASPVCALGAPVASGDGIFPPPGLYRVDTEGSMQRNRGELPAIMQHMAQDGASGNARVAGGRANGAQTTRNYPGQGPVNYCMPARPAGGAMPVATGCTSGAPVTAPGSISYAATCGGLKMQTTIRKVDDKTWEYKVVSTESGAAVTGQPDYAGARGVLAAQAKNGATAAERAKAAGLLAQMDEYEKEMKGAAAELAQARAEMGGQAGAMPVGSAGAQSRERTSIHRLTRIAATCTSAGK